MIGLLAGMGYLMGAILGAVFSYYVYGGNLLLMILTGGFLGGLLGTILPWGYWGVAVPKAIKNAVHAIRTGVLIVAIGADKKVRLLPGKSDGFVIRPIQKPYSEKYVWVADGESAYPVHQGKNAQAVITFMGYPFPLEARYAAAISEFRKKGFKSLEDLKTALELPTLEDLDRRIRELESLREEVEKASDEDIQREYGAPKPDVLNEIDNELEKLYRVRDVVEKHGAKGALEVKVDGATVRASDLIAYLVWRHHPAELQRLIVSETNAYLARMKTWDWIRPMIPLIIISAMAIIGVLAAIKMLAPEQAKVIIQNATTTAKQVAGNASRVLPSIGG